MARRNPGEQDETRAPRHGATFHIDPRFDAFFALETLHHRESRIHPAWKRRTLERLGARFLDSLDEVGHWQLWDVLPDVLGSLPLGADFAEIVTALEAADESVVVEAVLEGLLHDAALARTVAQRERSLRDAIATVAADKREWLAFVDLYPPASDQAGVRTIEAVVRDPGAFRRRVVSVLARFWEASFQETWHGLGDALRRSAEEKERLYLSCDLAEFARQILLRVEVDEAAGVLRAMRGGYELPLDALACLQLLPSAFNDRRLWYSGGLFPAATAVFPYFDPTLSVERSRVPSIKNLESEIDPALVLKALGDGTRFAIALLLARAPHSSAELSRELGLSPPTIAHHVFQLREAGLLDERRRSRSVVLSLRREVIEQLSAMTLRRLFGDEAC